MLEADMQLRLSRLALDVTLTVAAGKVVALLGPNASGKSTTLRGLVGLHPLTFTGTGATGPGRRGRGQAGIHVRRPAVEGGNAWRGQISAIDLMGDRVRVHVKGVPAITAEVSPAVDDELKLDDGGDLWTSVSPDAIVVYPP